MEDYSKLISYCDNLIGDLKDKKDSISIGRCFEDMDSIRSFCDVDFAKIKAARQEYENKIEACKQRTESVKSELISDEELERLYKELEEEHEKEGQLLEELRAITANIGDLEQTSVSVHEQSRAQKIAERDERSAMNTLSMLASVTDIIPNLSDLLKVSGHIIDREKKMVKNFEFDSTRMTEFDMCNNIWQMKGP